MAGWVSVGVGQDRNFDLLNYHLYDAYALLHGRLGQDLFVAGVESYANPLPDLPYYALSMWLAPGWPRLVAFLAGLPFGVLIVVALGISRAVFATRASRVAWLAPLATFLGISGATIWSEIGTTFGDMPMAVLTLTGLWLPLRLLRHHPGVSRIGWLTVMAASGALMGGAAGLKPVACVFAPGAALAFAVARGISWRRMIDAGAYCVAWLIMFAAVYGWWGLRLLHRFGNPTFPRLNDVFRSPWLPSAPFTDQRSLPRDMWQAIFYPFYWLNDQADLVSELQVRDPRFALAYLSLVALAIAAVRWRRGAPEAARRGHDPVVRTICLFFVISFVIWERMFSILRYAMPLEALTGIIILLGLRSVVAHRSSQVGVASALRVGGIVVAASVFVSTSLHDWGRLDRYAPSVFDVHAPPVPDNAVVVFPNRPTAFVAPFLPGANMQFVGIADLPLPSHMGDRIRQSIDAHQDVLGLLDQVHRASNVQLLRDFGRRIDAATCRPVVNPFIPDLTLCRLVPLNG